MPFSALAPGALRRAIELRPCGAAGFTSDTRSTIRVARELDERQAHAAHEDAVGTNLRRRLEPCAAHRRNDVVLIDAVAADAEAADQLAAFVDRHAAGKDLYAVGDGRERRARWRQRVRERRRVAANA